MGHPTGSRAPIRMVPQNPALLDRCQLSGPFRNRCAWAPAGAEVVEGRQDLGKNWSD